MGFNIRKNNIEPRKPKIKLEDIAKAYQKAVKSNPNYKTGLDFTVVNPLFGYMFKFCGCLENIRFYSSEIIINHDEQMRRDFARDESNNSLTSLAIRLFPSFSGKLSCEMNSESSFTKVYFVDNQDFDNVKTNEGRTKNIRMLGEVFARLLKNGTSDNLAKPRDPSLFELFEYDLFLPSLTPGLNNIILKLLFIHAYALEILETASELEIYLGAISDGLDNPQFVQSLILDDRQKRIFKDANFRPFKACFLKMKQPVSGNLIPAYDRKSDKFITGQSFADCVDIVILHLCNCMFYSNERDECVFDQLAKQEENVSEECSKLLDFYRKYGNEPFDIKYQMKKDWSKVVQGLSDNEVEDLSINYARYEYRNQLSPGILNIMAVLTKICNAEEAYKSIIMPRDSISKNSITEKLCIFLNKVSNGNITVDVKGNNIEEHDFDGTTDFCGDFEITFVLKPSEISMRTMLQTFPSSTSFTLISIENNLEQGKMPQPSPFSALASHAILSSLSTKYIKGNVKNEGTDISGSLFEILYNQGPLKINSDLKNLLIFYYKNMKYNEEIVKKVIEVIVKSADIQYCGTEAIFRPFFFYIEDLFSKLTDEEIVQTWASLYNKSLVIDLEVIRSLWNGLVESNSNKIQKLRLDLFQYTADDFKYILSTVKDTLVNLKLSDFSEDDTIWLKLLEDFLVDNNVLRGLSVRICSYDSLTMLSFLDMIKNKSTLKTLNLSGSQFEVRDAKLMADVLRVNDCLIALDISECFLGDEKAEIIADALKTNTSLKVLNISENNLTSPGFRCIADALKTNNTLEKLNISKNFCNANDIFQLACSQASLVSVSENSFSLTGCIPNKKMGEKDLNDRTRSILNRISQYKRIEWIADALKINTSLTHLACSNCEIKKEDLQSLADALKTNQTLAVLDISANALETGSYKYIADMLKENKLKTMDISNCSYDSDEAKNLYEKITEHQTLEELVIGEYDLIYEYLQRPQAENVKAANLKLIIKFGTFY